MGRVYPPPLLFGLFLFSKSIINCVLILKIQKFRMWKDHILQSLKPSHGCILKCNQRPTDKTLLVFTSPCSRVMLYVKLVFFTLNESSFLSEVPERHQRLLCHYIWQIYDICLFCLHAMDEAM